MGIWRTAFFGPDPRPRPDTELREVKELMALLTRLSGSTDQPPIDAQQVCRICRGKPPAWGANPAWNDKLLRLINDRLPPQQKIRKEDPIVGAITTASLKAAAAIRQNDLDHNAWRRGKNQAQLDLRRKLTGDTNAAVKWLISAASKLIGHIRRPGHTPADDRSIRLVIAGIVALVGICIAWLLLSR